MTQSSRKVSLSLPTVIWRRTSIFNPIGELVEWLRGIPVSTVERQNCRKTHKDSTTVRAETQRASGGSIHVGDKLSSPKPFPWCKLLVSSTFTLSKPPHRNKSARPLLFNLLALPSSYLYQTRLNTLSTINKKPKLSTRYFPSFFFIFLNIHRMAFPAFLLLPKITKTLAMTHSDHHFTFYQQLSLQLNPQLYRQQSNCNLHFNLYFLFLTLSYC